MLAIAAIGAACVVSIRSPGCSQSSHYALVRALSTGTAQVDQLGLRCDNSTVNGATFSNKAPGLALFTLPWYSALEAAQLLPEGEANGIWAVSLWGSVLPLIVMLWLLALVVIRLEIGPPAFVVGCTGLATLALPLGSLFFSHALSTTLGFASFAALLRARAGPPQLRFVALGGLLAGLSVTTDYPLALLVLALGVYVAWGSRSGLVPRAGAFGAGVGAGILPLLAYNRWAFGSPFHISYTSNAVGANGGPAGGGGHASGLWGVELPSLQALADVLAADRGLLVTTPVVAAGVAGLVLLVRSGRHRAEAALALGVTGAFLLYEASLSQGPGWPFGGASPGARFFLPAIPFAMLGIGPAFKRAPGAVAALAAVSAVQMIRIFITIPVVEDAATWSQRLREGSFTSTVLTAFAGTGGWLGALPILVALGVGVGASTLSAVRTTGIEWRLSDAVTAFCAWMLIAFVGPRLTDLWRPGEAVTVIAVIAVMTALVIVGARPHRAVLQTQKLGSCGGDERQRRRLA